ncbi:hypothetical protein RYR39_003470, partial [Yersinia ruckeri]|nr:hypothetical protein [Yersinia ruckeri]
MSQALNSSAIQEIRNMAMTTLVEEKLSSADCLTIALPDNVAIHSLEKF